MSGANVWRVYRQWLRARRVSTLVWSLGLVAVVASTAVFYPSLKDLFRDMDVQSGGMAAVMGLNSGIDPSTPLGFLWSNLYANIVPWVLIALGIALGSASIAGDEAAGTLEYLLSKPVRRSEVVLARWLAMVTIVAVVAVTSAIALLVVSPLVDLTSGATSATGGAAPGVGLGNIVDGTVASIAVGLGGGAIAFLIGAVNGRHSLATGVAAGYSVAGYLLYTLSSVSGEARFLTWASPWRWYVEDAMFINGLTWEVLLPMALAVASLVAGLWLFQRRDLVG